jgi:hypothetical protein
MKKRYFQKEQKYGVELPKTVRRALEIDKETGTTFRIESIRKEMCVGDRVITLYLLLLRFRILTTSITIIFFKLL